MVKTKPAGYWGNYANVERELKEVIDEIGHFPSRRELNKLGRPGFSNGIAKYKIRLEPLRKKLGYHPSRKPSGYWKDWKNVHRELKKIIRSLKRFPSTKEIQRLGGESLLSSITNYHGSLFDVRTRMGYGELRKPRGYWRDFANIKRELRNLATDLGHFPTSEEVREINTALCSAISTYHNGYINVRKKMNKPSTVKEPGYWRCLENVLQESIRFMEAHPEYESLPSGRNLNRYGANKLRTAIAKYHGGFPAFRRKLDEYLGRETESDNAQLESLLNNYAPGVNTDEH